MNMERIQRRALLSWASVGLLAILGSVLAVLQYRWIGEVSRAEHGKLRDGLQLALNRLSRDFDSEIATASRALQPTGEQVEQMGREAAYASRYAQWASASRHRQLVRRVALAVPQDGKLVLQMLDPGTTRFSTADWPESWRGQRDRTLARMKRGGPGPSAQDETALVELPRFGTPGSNAPPGRMLEQEWLIVEIDVEYVRDAMLPELLQRYLAGAGKLEYEAEVAWQSDAATMIYQSTSDSARRIGRNADASVLLFDTLGVFRRPPPERKDAAKGPQPAPPGPGRGRWQLLVRHQDGSLEAIVARARWRNLAISGAILLLMLGAVAALVRVSRQAQQLAELQLSFVEGVSHELRTPLTVIRTAAFNLKRKFSNNPAQVERYGSLIEKESEKLTALVEQVLRFASARAGNVVRAREPVSVVNIIEEGLQSSHALEDPRCVVEKSVEPGLPLVLADEIALKHVIQNLLDNAVKYGTEGSTWIGLSAARVTDAAGPAVEIRVADHGPGIPRDEQERIFDPFFRGRRAVEDQIHGTGLGLNLVKKIVEAHGGTIRVKSEPMGGAEFVVRIPAASAEEQDEFANSVG